MTIKTEHNEQVLAVNVPLDKSPEIIEDSMAIVKEVLQDRQTGYHLKDIPQGKYGELSKIKEELSEAEDAEEQGVKIMLLVELSDMLGGIEGYLDNHFPGLTIDDLRKMSNVTKRAFKSGKRTPKDQLGTDK